MVSYRPQRFGIVSTTLCIRTRTSSPITASKFLSLNEVDISLHEEVEEMQDERAPRLLAVQLRGSWE